MVLALCLIICYVSCHINPSSFWLTAIVGLAYPFFLIVNLLFLVYWVIRWKIEFYIPLIAIVIGLNHLNTYVQLPFGKKETSAEADINLLTYNANMFQLYRWSEQPPVYKEVIEFVNKNRYNVVCFQEFFVRNDRFTEEDAKKMLGMNINAKYVVSDAQTSYGIATFSQFPIVSKGEVKFTNTYNACIYTDIKVNNDTIRVYNTHLQSTRFNNRNLKFLLNTQTHSGSDAYEEIWDIVSRLRDAYEKRSSQVDSIAAHAARCKYPTIICGDFNDSPISYTYNKLSKGRKDSFIEAGVGTTNTYRKLWPAYRIDYILHSKQLKAISYDTPKIEFSDHYPVTTRFTIN